MSDHNDPPCGSWVDWYNVMESAMRKADGCDAPDERVTVCARCLAGYAVKELSATGLVAITEWTFIGTTEGGGRVYVALKPAVYSETDEVPA
ncbi:MAG TPA: hypothetical protein VE326_11215 [Candidatus Binatia bacterium]|nr:hypothetical protein [Candidatus Binatia bacterium]